MNKNHTQNVFRILDAAANRGREAIRVLEDVVRFIYDDLSQTELLKSLRHDFTDIARLIPLHQRLEARSTTDDVGTLLCGSGEYRRNSLVEILAANFARLQESLRSLEEMSKMALPPLAPRWEQLRYRTYTIEKTLMSELLELPGDSLSPKRSERQERLAESRFYIIADTDFPLDKLLALAEQGANPIQLRDKNASDKEIIATGISWKKAFEQWGIAGKNPKPLLIMNDRPDLAVLADFAGVHLGQDDAPVDDVRKIVGPDRLIGLSTHSVEQLDCAMTEDVDYLGAGPVFPSATKQFDQFPGLAYLAAAAARSPKIPVFAIGGITHDNYPQVLATGINRVALAGAIKCGELRVES